jgi:flagellar protein FliS
MVEMSYGNSSAQYLEAEIMSRPKEWLVPLLYEHLLSRLHRADVQMEIGDLGGKAESLAKANEIVLELATSLDRERGGSIAGHLGSLYAFFASEIMEIGRTLDRPRLARLIPIIADLHEAWVDAAEQVAPRGRNGTQRLAVAV